MSEDVGKLEAELKRKRGEMETLLEELKTRAVKLPEKKEITTEELKAKLEEVKEMQLEILQKKEGLEKALKEIGDEMRSLEELKAKAEKEDVRPAMQALVEQVKEKKARLEKAIREMEELKEKYAKKFLV